MKVATSPKCEADIQCGSCLDYFVLFEHSCHFKQGLACTWCHIHCTTMLQYGTLHSSHHASYHDPCRK
jgi:hypothetical protein